MEQPTARWVVLLIQLLIPLLPPQSKHLHTFRHNPMHKRYSPLSIR